MLWENASRSKCGASRLEIQVRIHRSFHHKSWQVAMVFSNSDTSWNFWIRTSHGVERWKQHLNFSKTFSPESSVTERHENLILKSSAFSRSKRRQNVNFYIQILLDNHILLTKNLVWKLASWSLNCFFMFL